MVIHRYIWREITLTFLGILVVLVSVLAVNALTVFLQDAAMGKMSILNVFQLVGYQLSPIVTYIIPFALFLSIITVLKRLYHQSEIVVMNAGGMSQFQLTSIVMALAFLVSISTAWLSMWFNPYINGRLIELKASLAQHYKISSLVPKRFIEIGKGRFIYASQINHQKEQLHDVFLVSRLRPISGSSGRRWEVVKAKWMDQVINPDLHEPFIRFHNGFRYEIEPGQHTVKKTQFDTYAINLLGHDLSGEHAHPLAYKKQVWMIPTMALFKQRSVHPRALAEWQLRLSIPIAVLIASLLAMALTHSSPRQKKRLEYLISIVIYITYMVFVFLVNGWMQKGVISMPIYMWVVHGFFLSVALAVFIYRYGWDRLKMRIRKRHDVN